MMSTTMKPFDLQAALRGGPVVTRDGRRVLQVAYFPDAPGLPVLAYVQGSEFVYAYPTNGLLTRGTASRNDLFMAPTWFTLGGVEVPLPEMVAPAPSTLCWSPDILQRKPVHCYRWHVDDQHHSARLERGLVHLTEEAAELHAKALVAANEAARTTP